MSDKDIDLDDYGDMDGLDDFNMEFESEEPNVDRSPIARLGKGAWEKASSLENAAQMTKTIADNALPQGYQTMKQDADDAVGFARDLYDKSAKELKEPINGLKRIINSNIDKISILPDVLKSRIKAATVVEGSSSSGMDNAEESAITATLDATFKYQTRAQQAAQAQTLENEAAKGEVEAARFNTSSNYMKQIADSSTRQLDYTEQVAMQYQRKMLELSQRQFFATRDLLAAQKGYNADSLSQLKGITKNTALPEFVKMRGSEAYIQLTRERLMGKVNDTATKAMGNFAPAMKDAISGKISDIVGNVRDGIESVTDIGESLSDMVPDADAEDDGFSVDGLSTGGGVIAGGVLQKAAKALGGYLKDSGISEKYNIPELFDKYEYMSENKGQMLNEVIDSGKLGPLGEILKDLMPNTGGDNETVMANLAEIGTDVSIFDEITRRSIIEIIPGYLSKMLQQLTILTTGEDAEREVFSTDSETFETMSSAKDQLSDRMFGKGKASGVMSKALDMVEAIDPNNELPAEQRTALARQLIEDVNKTGASKGFDLKTYARGSEPTAEFIRNRFNIDNEMLERGIIGNTDLANENKILSRTYREMGTGYGDMEKELGKLNAYGNKDVARDLGIVGQRDGKDFINHDMKRDLFFDYINQDEELRERLAGRSVDSTIMNRQVDKAEKKSFTENLLKPRTKQDDTSTKEQERLMGHELKLRETAKFKSAVSNNRLNVPTAPINATIDTTEIEALIKGIPLNLRESIFESIEGQLGLPVHVLSGLVKEDPAAPASPVQGPTSPLDGYPSDGLKEDMEQVKILLQGIIDAGGITGQFMHNAESPTNIADSIKQGSGKLYGYAKQAASASFNLSGSMLNRIRGVADQGFNMAKSALGSLKDSKGGTEAIDIMSKATGKVMLSARKMLDGEYFDESGKVITSLKDIKGDIKDAAGKIIVSGEDLEKDGVDKTGDDIKLPGLAAMLGKVKSGIGTVWQGQLNIASMIAKAGGAALKTAKDFLDKPMDIYIKGKGREPAIRVSEMELGSYMDSDTGKVLLTMEDILSATGNVVDSTGNIKISKEDRAAGLVNFFGDSIGGSALLSKVKGVMGIGLKTAGKIGGFMRDKANDAFNAVKKLGSTIWSKVPKSDMSFSGMNIALPELTGQSNILRSIFNYMQGRWGTIEGVDLPSAKEMKIPGVSVKDVLDNTENMTNTIKDKLITAKDKAKDKFNELNESTIISEAKDKLNEQVESLKESASSSTDKLLNRINGQHDGQMSLDLEDDDDSLKRKAKQAVHDVKESLNVKLDSLSANISKLAEKVVPEDTDGVQLELDIDDTKDMQKSSVKDIMASMLKLLTPEKEKRGDGDGDGLRDGGWRSILAKRKAKKASAAEGFSKQVSEEGDEDKPEESGIGGILGMLLAGGGTLVANFASSLASKMGGMMSSVLASTLGKIPGLGGMFGGDGVDLPDSGKPKGKKPGLLKRAAKFAGRGLWGAAKFAGRAALMGGTSLLSGAATLASGAASAATALAVANPITATVLAVGAVAYGGYKLYKYLDNRKAPVGVERLRFIQYGINTENEDELSMIRKLEASVMDKVVIKGTDISVSEEPSYFVGEHGEDFGINMEDAHEVQKWVSWFSQRCIPILFTHLSAAVSLGIADDVTEIESNLSDDDMRRKFVRAGIILTAYGKSNPMRLNVLGWPGASPMDAIGIVGAAKSKILGETGTENVVSIDKAKPSKDKDASTAAKPVTVGKVTTAPVDELSKDIDDSAQVQKKTISATGSNGQPMTVVITKAKTKVVDKKLAGLDDMKLAAKVKAEAPVKQTESNIVKRSLQNASAKAVSEHKSINKLTSPSANIDNRLPEAMAIADERRRYMIAQSEMAIRQRRQANDILAELLEMTVLFSGKDKETIDELRKQANYAPKSDVAVIKGDPLPKDIVLPMDMKKRALG